MAKLAKLAIKKVKKAKAFAKAAKLKVLSLKAKMVVKKLASQSGKIFGRIGQLQENLGERRLFPAPRVFPPLPPMLNKKKCESQ